MLAIWGKPQQAPNPSQPIPTVVSKLKALPTVQVQALRAAAADQQQAQARELAMVEARVRTALANKDDAIAALHGQLAATLRRLREAEELL